MVPVNRFPFTIGRSSENDLPLSNPSVSKRHATIEKQGTQLSVVDQGSRNHVFVNDRRVERQIVAPGDVLRVGEVEILLRRCPTLHVHSAAKKKLAAVYSAQPDGARGVGVSDTIHLKEAEPAAAVRSEETEWHRRLLSGGPPRMADIHERAMDAVAACVDFDRCFLLLFEDSSPQDLALIAMRFGPHYDARHAPEIDGEICISREILRRVAEKREIVRVTEHDREIQLRESFIMSAARTALCFPLVVRERVSGVLYLDRVRGGKNFSDEDVDAISPLAEIVALRIENLRLIEELGAQ